MTQPDFDRDGEMAVSWSPKVSNTYMLGFMLFMPAAQAALGLVAYSLSGVSMIAAQGAFMIIAFGAYIIIFSIASESRVGAVLPLKPLKPASAALVALSAICMIPLMNMLSAVTMLFSENRISELLTGSAEETGFFVNLFVLAVLPAFFEEIVVRGIALRGYGDRKLVTTAFVSGVFFACMHMNFQQAPYAFVMGFFFALLVRFTGSIYASMLAHFVINAVAVVSMNLSYAEDASAEISNAELISLLPGLAVVAAATTGAAVLLIRALRAANANDADKEPEPEPEDKSRVFGWQFWGVIVIFIVMAGGEILASLVES
jgi:membrane protease YdiL (CAAX protease family)